MDMYKKRVMLSIFILIILMSTLVSAGFVDFFKGIFTGSPTGLAVGAQCSSDADCGESELCNLADKRCIEFPQDKIDECKGKFDLALQKLNILQNRLNALRGDGA